MNVYQKNFQQLMQRPGAPSQTDLAAQVGCSVSHLHNILVGRVVGSEQIRRRIADALRVTYEEMAGVSPVPLPLDNLRVCRVPLDHIAADQAAGNLAGREALMIPIVSIAAAVSGRLVSMDTDYLGWFAAVDIPGERLVAVRAPDDSLAPEIAADNMLIVDRDQIDVQDGDWFLVGPPAPTPIRRLWRTDNDMVIAQGALAQPPTLLQGGKLAAIVGRIIKVYDK